MTDRQPDPPGVTYQGEYPVYTVYRHGRPIGITWTDKRRHGHWFAAKYRISDEQFAGSVRREAVEQLVAWLDQ